MPGPKPETFTAYIEWDSAARLYAGTIPGVRGAHSQGATLDELRGNLKEALELCLEQEANRDGNPPVDHSSRGPLQ